MWRMTPLPVKTVTNVVSVEDVLRVCKRLDGVKENPPGSNYTMFNVWCKQGPAFWCAMYVSYVFWEAGMPLSIGNVGNRPCFTWCPDGPKWFKKKGWWHAEPKAGDVVFFSWHQPDVPLKLRQAEHVGIVSRVLGNGYFESWEGNTNFANNANGDRVMLRKRHISEVVGFGRPPYGQEVSAKLPVATGKHTPWPGKIFILTSPVMTDPDISEWKEQMVKRGWKLPVNDNFDVAAREVLTKFQREKGLKVDGQLGPSSWNAAWALAVS